MVMTREDRRADKEATNCHVCERLLVGDSLRDH